MWTERIGDLVKICIIEYIQIWEDSRYVEPIVSNTVDEDGNTFETIEFVDPAKDGETILTIRADTLISLYEDGVWDNGSYGLRFYLKIPLTKAALTKKALGIYE